jgi:hypothetical protein
MYDIWMRACGCSSGATPIEFLIVLGTVLVVIKSYLSLLLYGLLHLLHLRGLHRTLLDHLQVSLDNLKLKGIRLAAPPFDIIHFNYFHFSWKIL